MASLQQTVLVVHDIQTYMASAVTGIGQQLECKDLRQGTLTVGPGCCGRVGCSSGRSSLASQALASDCLSAEQALSRWYATAADTLHTLAWFPLAPCVQFIQGLAVWGGKSVNCSGSHWYCDNPLDFDKLPLYSVVVQVIIVFKGG